MRIRVVVGVFGLLNNESNVLNNAFELECGVLQQIQVVIQYQI